MTRPAVLLLLLALTACAHLDASDRERHRLAWHACTRDKMAAHAWLNCQ